jgi:hypothetical protein
MAEYIASVKSAYAKPAREPWIGNEPLAPAQEKPDYSIPTAFSKPRNLRALKKQIKVEGVAPLLVEGLLAGEGVHLAVGDSGLGKSPLFYQLGLCVAAGIDFLGLKTTKGKVIYFDLENPDVGSEKLQESLRAFLGLTNSADAEENFLTVDQGEPTHLKALIEEYQPKLVIIDPFRSFDEAAADNDNLQSAKLFKMMKRLAKKHKCAFLIVHHIRKNTNSIKGEPIRLETSESVLDFMKLASGNRSMVNLSDNRLGIDVPNPTGMYKEADLLLQGYGKLKGQTPLMCIERRLDDDGDPIGYKHLVGSVNLLSGGEERETYLKLPIVFTFQDAKFTYGHSHMHTRKFLAKCERLALIKNTDKGQFTKLV